MTRCVDGPVGKHGIRVVIENRKIASLTPLDRSDDALTPLGPLGCAFVRFYDDAATNQAATFVRGHGLHSLVLRSAATFRRYPVNNLIRIHDVARLAVNAVGKVDL